MTASSPRKFRFRLRTRVVVAVGLPILVLASFFALFVPAEVETAANDALKHHGITVTRLISKLVTPLVLKKEAKRTAQMLETVKTDESIRFVIVLTEDGTPLASTGPVQTAESLPPIVTGSDTTVTTQRHGALFYAQQALVYGPSDAPKRLGTVLVAFARRSVTDIRQRTAQTTLYVTLLVLALGSLLAWIFSGNIARPLLHTSNRLSRVSQDLADAARTREEAVAREAGAVESTRRTMDLLLATAQHISETTNDVLQNAEQTLQSSKDIAVRIDQLNLHAEKVSEVLTGIMQVADRADLLALNAAVEGTKAGKEGQGFILVANEMRRLAENLMASVESIQRLLHDVRASSQHAVAASLSGTASSEETTRSVRDITRVTQQQQVATVQVSKSMEEMTELLNQAMSDIKYTNKSARALSEVAHGLAGLITPTTLPKASEGDDA